MIKIKDKDDIDFIDIRNGMKFKSVLTIPTNIWRSGLSIHAKILYIIIYEYEIDTRHWLGSKYQCAIDTNNEIPTNKMKISAIDFNYYIGEIIVDYIFSLENEYRKNLLTKCAQELIENELIRVGK